MHSINQITNTPTYHAKLLLFGEYTVVKGSRALAVPYAKYTGAWSFETSSEQQVSADALQQFHAYLMDFQKSKKALWLLDLKDFEEDLADGLWFDSNIPMGYGLGSSGSLCAAIYDRYGLDKIKPHPAITSQQLGQLKSIFAQLESYFHGSSSGADPLVCYLRQPVLMSKTELKAITLPKLNAQPYSIFLLNTQIPRKTEPLVNIFLDKCKNEDFEQLCKNELAYYSDQSMNAFLQNDVAALFENIQLLSAFQYEHFQPMIPEAFRKIWRDGLDSNTYTLKLCGAGGGGFILGFTTDYLQTQKCLSGHVLQEWKI